ncbi:Hypothetical protein KLENKIAIHU_4568, partial [Klenkia terrae]
VSAGGPALFDDDLACDVRDVYRRMLEDRVPDDEATARCTTEWAGLPPEEEPVFWLALAATQSSCGRLAVEVRSRALEVIDSGVDVDRWRGSGPAAVAARAAALASLREQLTGPQPGRKAIRRPWRDVTDLEAGAALAWTAGNGLVAVLRVVQLLEDPFARTVSPVLERLAWVGREVPPPDVVAGLPAASGWHGWEPDDPAALGRRPAACIPFRLRKRDPGWAEVGMVRCGHVPPRPGDDGRWDLWIAHIMWDGLVEHLEQRLTTFPAEHP